MAGAKGVKGREDEDRIYKQDTGLGWIQGESSIRWNSSTDTVLCARRTG